MKSTEDLWNVFCLGAVFGVLLGASVISFNSDRFKIESRELIKPQIKLEINNNKVDTVFVYRVKK